MEKKINATALITNSLQPQTILLCRDISKFAMHYIIEEIDEDTSMEDLQKMMVVALIYRLLVCFYEVSYWLQQILIFNYLILDYQPKIKKLTEIYFSNICQMSVLLVFTKFSLINSTFQVKKKLSKLRYVIISL